VNKHCFFFFPLTCPIVGILVALVDQACRPQTDGTGAPLFPVRYFFLTIEASVILFLLHEAIVAKWRAFLRRFGAVAEPRSRVLFQSFLVVITGRFPIFFGFFPFGILSFSPGTSPAARYDNPFPFCGIPGVLDGWVSPFLIFSCWSPNNDAATFLCRAMKMRKSSFFLTFFFPFLVCSLRTCWQSHRVYPSAGFPPWNDPGTSVRVGPPPLFFCEQSPFLASPFGSPDGPTIRFFFFASTKEESDPGSSLCVPSSALRGLTLAALLLPFFRQTGGYSRALFSLFLAFPLNLPSSWFRRVPVGVVGRCFFRRGRGMHGPGLLFPFFHHWFCGRGEDRSVRLVSSGLTPTRDMVAAPFCTPLFLFATFCFPRSRRA